MEMLSLFLFFLVSIGAGFCGTLVGGGALITTPLLIFFGLPPQSAIGTSKFGSIGTVLAGTYNFAKHKLINYRIGLIMVIFLGIGTVLGSITVINMGEDIVKKMIAVFMLVMLAIILFNKGIGIEKRRIKINKWSWIVASVLMFFIGIYAGFFGGGYGTLISYVLLFVFGQTFLESAGTRKIPGIFSNIIAFFIFFINGLVNFVYGVILFIGSFIGAFIGSHYAPKIGNEWIRRGFFAVVLIMAIKLLID